MSVSSLPEWKQLLLERKRREEEERERREKEEEEKLASMPAWKRSILQRRRAKQEEKGGDGEALSDSESSAGVPPGSERSLSPDPAPQRPDPAPQRADKLLHDRVSMETIVPVHENPFVRTQSGGWRGGREGGEAAGGGGGEGEARGQRSGRAGRERRRRRRKGTQLCLRTFRVENIIIIEQEHQNAFQSRARRGGRDPRRDQSREAGREEGAPLRLDAASGERGHRVSRLLSRFGEHHHRPPSRSKSSESFVRILRSEEASDGNSEDEEEARTRAVNGTNSALRGVPKRSFSFSDRAALAKDNGVNGDGRRGDDKKGVEGSQRLKEPQGNRGDDLEVCGILDAGRGGKTAAEGVRSAARRTTDKAPPPADRRSLESADDVEGDKGFTVVPVRNTEGIAFARRVPLRLEGRAAVARAVQGAGKPPREDGGAGNGRAEPAGAGAAPRHSGDPLGETQRASRATDAHLYRDGRGEGRRPALPVAAAVGTPRGLLEIQIPRTVFYVAEDPAEKRRRSFPGDEGRDGGRAGRVGGGCRDCCGSVGGVGGGGGGGGGGADGSSVGGGMDGGGGCHDDRGVAVERRDSWRVGKPLSRVESLREKIRQREREKRIEREREGAIDLDLDLDLDLGGEGEMERERPGITTGSETLQDAGSGDGAETTGSGQTPSGVRFEAGGAERDEEPEAPAAQAEDRSDKQEALATQASADVTQEVCAVKKSPQLPVSGSFRAAVADEEVPVAAAAEPPSEPRPGALRSSSVDHDGDGYYDDDDGDGVDLLRHVEEELSRHVGWHRAHEGGGGERQEEEEEEKEAREEEAQRQEASSASPDYSSEGLSPSPPPCLSAPGEMSRIYNVKAVSATRTGGCSREPGAPSVELLRVTPHLPPALLTQLRGGGGGGGGGSQGDLKPRPPGDVVPGAPSLQRRLEKFQLKEPAEAVGPPRVHEPRDWTACRRDQGTSSPTPRLPAWTQRAGSPSNHQGPAQPSPSTRHGTPTTGTPDAPLLRSPSPEGAARASESGPTPFSSPVLCSPAQSPSTSPCPPCSSTSSSTTSSCTSSSSTSSSSTPSTTLFSVRSSSRGQGSRGATTITICPRRPTADGGGGGGGAAAEVTTTATTPVQSQTSNDLAPPKVEPKKKRFPRVEEIEVIGGYQNLERSCLSKTRDTAKRVKVCFSEAQLEQVCEYPSESSMMAAACLQPPDPEDLIPPEKEEGGWYEEEEEEEEEEGGLRGPETTATRVLKMSLALGRRHAPRHIMRSSSCSAQ
ncbi:retinitis pigmentosa 1-like 1 protein [Gadus macrocephalus]|uniref:retinitis pigmentosa 1-like 1 protein n=1 Tax=Gadus macrocephalus TaxID=80720 RepID=UPI0028CB6846|nr:retinitis pigmentosa 1-like 1 protein [Gadus macrocephalus]